ncbi:MAG: hypothetical protein IIC71_12860 [Acidobacteria bacterium]|nr:hypothetical protein [Acidobacteriota bacterium]
MESPKDAVDSPPKVIPMGLASEVNSAGTLRVGLRSYYSTHFLAAAQDAATRATELEAGLVERHGKRFTQTHHSPRDNAPGCHS